MNEARTRSAGATSTSGKALQAVVSSELMENHLPCRAIDGHRTIRHVADSAGDPAIFSIGNDGQLYMTISGADTRAGWKQFSLTDHLRHRLNSKLGVTVTAFDVAVTADKKFQLVVAASDGDVAVSAPTERSPNPFHVYVTKPFDIHQSAFDWNHFCEEWKEIPLQYLNESVVRGGNRFARDAWMDGRSQIRSTTIFDTSQVYPRFRLASSGQQSPSGVGLLMMVFDPNQGDPKRVTSPMPLPDIWTKSLYLPAARAPNEEDILRIANASAIGNVSGDEGAFYLTRKTNEAGSERALAFNSFAAGFGQNGNVTAWRQFPLPAETEGEFNRVLAFPTRSGATDLFVAGSGIYLYPDAVPGKEPVQIASSMQLPNIVQMSVANPASHRYAIYVSIRVAPAKGGTGRIDLYLIEYDRSTNTAREPMLIETGIEEFATSFHSQVERLEVMTVKTEIDKDGNNKDELHHHYQDPATRIWRESNVHFDDLTTYVTFPSFTTRVRISDQDDLPLAMTEVSLTSSTWIRALVNGRLSNLAPDQPLRVTTDTAGVVDIVLVSHTIASPQYLLRCDGFSNTISITPQEVVLERLADKPTAEIQKVASVNEATAKAIRDLAALPSSGTRKRDLGELSGRMGVGFDLDHAHGVPATFELPFAQDMALRITVSGGNVAISQGQKRSIDDIGTAIRLFFGEAVRWVSKATHDFVMTIEHAANAIANVVIEIGGKILSFLVKTAEEIAHVIGTLINKAASAFKDIINFVGCLFNWDDILRTHRFMVDSTNQMFTAGHRGIASVKQFIETNLDEVKSKFQAQLDELRTKESLRVPLTSIRREARQAEPSQFKAKDDLANSPPSNWGLYHLKQNGISNGASLSVGANAPLDLLATFAEQCLVPAANALDNKLRQLFADIGGFELGVTSLSDIINLAGGDLLLGLLDAVEKLLLGLLDFLDRLIEFGKDAINKEIPVPLFGSLYSFVSGGQKLSVLDLACLIAAVPVTVGIKLLSGKAPFETDEQIAETRDAQIAMLDVGLGQLVAPREGSGKKRAEGEESAVSREAWDQWHKRSQVCAWIFAFLTLGIEGLKIASATLELTETAEAAAGGVAEEAGHWQFTVPSFIGLTRSAMLVGRQFAFIPSPYSQIEPERKPGNIYGLEWSVWGTYGAASALELVLSILAFSGRWNRVRGPVQGVVGLLEATGVIVLEIILTVLETNELKGTDEEPGKIVAYREEARNAYQILFGNAPAEDMSDRELSIALMNKIDDGQLASGLDEETWKDVSDKSQFFTRAARKIADLPVAMAQNSFHAAGSIFGSVSEIAAPFVAVDPEPESKAVGEIAVFGLLTVSGYGAFGTIIFQLLRLSANVRAGMPHRPF